MEIIHQLIHVGTLLATVSAWSRLYREFTCPLSVTTPLFTSNFTLWCAHFFAGFAASSPSCFVW
ncbi:MAG TPA: hypothetical protein VIX11_08365 [Candidatus Acidoferrum sp.]